MCMWIVDADQIQLSDFNENVLFKTMTVNSFINNQKMLGIEGPKGLGKTFLLKCKRIMSQNSGVYCMPRDAMCDILDKVTLNESMARFLEDYSNWIDLWKLSICISLHKEFIKTGLIEELGAEEDKLYWEIYYSNYLITPCQIMNWLLNCQRTDVRKIQTRIPLYMAIIKSRIRSAVHIYIDKTDQALRDHLHYIGGESKMSRGPTNNSFWMFGQLALAEAAYSIYIQNNHIKVYFSIRSEALVGAASDTDLYLQLQSYIVKLEYTHQEIQGMFNHYIALEDDNWLVKPHMKNSDPEMAFTGLNKIGHGYVKGKGDTLQKESVFDYIFRHTLKRPRDIMHICHKLCYSSLRCDLSQDQKTKIIRHIVNQESRLLLQSYIREIGPFVFDNNTEAWGNVWSMIDTNVFSYEYAQDICVRVNEKNMGQEIDCDKKCESCPHFKPFSALYNTGLLGRDTKNNVLTEYPTISFQSTGNVIIDTNEDLLPRSQLYFLHPMLTNKIEASRKEKGKPFILCTDCIVGDGYEIDEYAIHTIRARENDRLNRKREKSVFLSSTCFDMNDTRRMLYFQLGDFDYNVIMSEANDFGTPSIDTNSYDYCLDKIENANGLIYIVGKRFGGVYMGSKYRSLAEELKNKAPEIGEPSISMMEYYRAKQLGKKTWVFTTKDIYNERQIFRRNGSKNDFKPSFVDSINVFRILNLITTSPEGNWFKTYIDLPDLLEIIKIEFGNW